MSRKIVKFNRKLGNAIFFLANKENVKLLQVVARILGKRLLLSESIIE